MKMLDDGALAIECGGRHLQEPHRYNTKQWRISYIAWHRLEDDQDELRRAAAIREFRRGDQPAAGRA